MPNHVGPHTPWIVDDPSQMDVIGIDDDVRGNPGHVVMD